MVEERRDVMRAGAGARHPILIGFLHGAAAPGLLRGSGRRRDVMRDEGRHPVPAAKAPSRCSRRQYGLPARYPGRGSAAGRGLR